MKTVVIDPGHGGSTMIGGSSPNNATGPNSLQEKTIALDIGIRVAQNLSQSLVNVILTRNSDTNLGLSARAQVASTNNADVFLSIHFNGSTNPSIQGSETWVETVSTSDSRLLAASVQQRLVGATGYNNRGVKSKGLGVLKSSVQSPATACCLTEISFLTNPAEEGRLGNNTYKDQVAMALSQALLDYLNASTGMSPANPIPEGDPNGTADG
jgi:N-acetylmuramoyl-L-alanine amidase